MSEDHSIPELRTDRRGAPKGSSGNVPHEVTAENRALVEKLAGLQISQAEIAMVLEVSPDTIQRHYADEFERGKALKGMKLRAHAYRQAFGVLVDPDDPSKGYKDGFQPNWQMTKFMLETQFGFMQSTKQVHEGGDPSKPLNVELTHIRRVIVDPKKPE